MTIRKKTLLSEIKEKAIFVDWFISFGGKSRGNRHLFRVNNIAKYLAEKEGGDVFTILAAAWVHDVALSVGNDDDPSFIYTKTLEFLKQFDLNEEEMEKIALCASSHETGEGELTLEAKIVHDADVVDKSGMLGVIRHIWKMTNLVEQRILTQEADLLVLKKHLINRESHVYTNTAKKLVHNLNGELRSFFEEKSSVEVMKEISQMARLGITSDKIAEKMVGSSHSYSSKIADQLKCTFPST